MKRDFQINKYTLFNSLGLLLILVAFILFLLLFRKLHYHASGDEGFHLLNYLKNQNIEFYISDSYTLIRNFFPNISNDPIVEFRILSLILNFTALVFFSVTVSNWLESKYNIEHKYLNIGLIMIAGINAQTYTQALYYDNIHIILIYLVFGLFFLSLSFTNWYLKSISITTTGFLGVFLIMNYLPAGVILVLSIFVLILFLENKDKILRLIIFYLIGLIIGSFLYSLIVNNLFVYINDLIIALRNSDTGHTPMHAINLTIAFLVKLISYILLLYFSLFFIIKIYKRKPDIFILYLLPLLLAFIVLYLRFFTKSFNSNLFIVAYVIIQGIYFYIYFINRELHKKITFTLLYLSLIILIYRYFHKSDILSFYIPIVFSVVLIDKAKLIRIQKSKIILFFFLFFFPIIGQIGTDVPVDAKFHFFLAFYAVLFILLFNLCDFKTIKNAKLPLLILFTYVCFLFHINNVYFGIIKDSKNDYYISNAVRERNIRFSLYEKLRYEKMITTLYKYGFKPGDEIISYGAEFTLVYISGGLAAKPFNYGYTLFSKNEKRTYLPNFVVIKNGYYEGFNSACKRLYNNPVSSIYDAYKFGGRLEWESNDSISLYCKKLN